MFIPFSGVFFDATSPASDSKSNHSKSNYTSEFKSNDGVPQSLCFFHKSISSGPQNFLLTHEQMCYVRLFIFKVQNCL